MAKASARAPETSADRLANDKRAQVQAILSRAKSLRLRVTALQRRLGSGAASRYDGRVGAALARLRSGIGRSPDVVLRPFRLGGPHGLRGVCVFVDGLADNQMVDQDLMLLAERTTADDLRAPASARAQAVAGRLSVGHVSYATAWSEIVARTLGGNTVLLVEGAKRAIVLDTVKFPARSIPTPDLERSVLGSHEGFNEILLTHMNQLRRYLQSPALRFESLTFGQLTGTQAVLAYVEGVTNPAIVSAVRRRLAAIQDATVISVSRLGSSLREHRYTPFPLVRQTPRVDFTAREVASGRVAVLMANTPFALIVPATFIDFYRTAEDYEGQFWGPTLDRIVRLAAFLIALYAPALYIALSEVNPDFMPTRLLWTVAGSRENLPFPPQVEVILMFGVFEILREAALRMPNAMSTALSTVGAVIIGTAVVNLGCPPRFGRAGRRRAVAKGGGWGTGTPLDTAVVHRWIEHGARPWPLGPLAPAGPGWRARRPCVWRRSAAVGSPCRPPPLPPPLVTAARLAKAHRDGCAGARVGAGTTPPAGGGDCGTGPRRACCRQTTRVAPSARPVKEQPSVTTAQGDERAVWLPEQRRQEIGRRIHATGRVSVREMAALLGVSEETVRRDLELLADRGIVERTHGGAVSPAWAAERSFAEQVRLHAAAKASMADLVFEAIAGVHRLVLDAGSSCGALAARLREMTDLEVVTNNVPAATTLSAAPGVRVLLVGGRLRQPTLSLVGDWATERLIAYQAEVAVLGVNGLTAAHGLFTPTPEEAAVKRAMTRAAREVWVLADASKFATHPEGHVFAQWRDVHHLVTERHAPAREVESIQGMGVHAHLV